jgi:Glycosyl hydrolase catalytic core
MRSSLVLAVFLLAACEGGGAPAASSPDAGNAGADAGARDGGLDAGSTDAGADAGNIDAGADAGSTDAGADAGSADAGSAGAGPADAGADGGAASGKSPKRGLAYNLASEKDLAALSAGVSWWYNWGTRPDAAIPAGFGAKYAADFIPMLWNDKSDAASAKAFLAAHPEVKYILVLNEPNLTDQANLTPQQAAAIWPQFEAVATAAGVQLVGPQMNYGTLKGYEDPEVWMDAFIAAYQAANGGRSPRIDYLGIHWYDYGLGWFLGKMSKYGKPFWVTEFANWHSKSDAPIDTLAKQEAQMTDMVNTCEGRSDVFRYSWFTGRMSNDPHYDSLLAADGVLTELGQLYISLPH